MEIFKNATFRRNVLISSIILLTSGAAFGLGRLSVLMGEKEPIAIENYVPEAATTSSIGIKPPQQQPSGVIISAEPAAPKSSAPPSQFIASKTGKSYYYPWCGIVKRIKKENQIIFQSRAEAEKAGYKPGNCAGLK